MVINGMGKLTKKRLNFIINDLRSKRRNLPRNYVDSSLMNNPIYSGWRDFIISELGDVDFMLTITFIHRQSDEIVIKSTGHLLNVINSSIGGSRFRKNGRHITGFAFLERHSESETLQDRLHIHILGKFPTGLHQTLSVDEFRDLVCQSIPNVKTLSGSQMIASGGIDVTTPYDNEGLLNYLSKQLTSENLGGRILFVGKDGLQGWESEQIKWINPGARCGYVARKAFY